MDAGAEWTFDAGIRRDALEFVQGESGSITLDVRTDTQTLHFFSDGTTNDLAESTHDLFGLMSIDAVIDVPADVERWIEGEISRLRVDVLEWLSEW